MITRIRAKNFKCLKHLDLPLKGLTVLTGLNGSGKSSVIQAILYMRQCVMNATRDDSFVSVREGGLHFTNAGDVSYQFSSDGEVKVVVGCVVGSKTGSEALNYVFKDSLHMNYWGATKWSLFILRYIQELSL